MSLRRNLAKLAAVAACCGFATIAFAQDYNYGGGTINAADLPPSARPGECYARVFVPAQSRTETEQVLAKAEGERIEIIPARYETVTEQIMVKAPSSRLVEVPAQYDYQEETMMVSPARTEWQKGPCDPKKQLANATGECLCLVEIPPRYKTVRKRVMTQPPTTRVIEIPAEYRTVTKTILADNNGNGIPGEMPRYDGAGNVLDWGDGPRERRIPIPAEYQTVTRQIQVSDARMEWVQIDCESRAPMLDRDTTMALQRALKAAGYNPGPIDGVYGRQTRNALNNFQRAKDLPVGSLNKATRRALNM